MLKVAVLPNYNVSLAEIIIPGADLSEQISTAGKEASGTGNMKFALNGALTIGTMDGANVEIRERVGDENIFIFGLSADEVADLRQSGDYHPASIIDADPALKRALDMIASGVFSPDEPDRFRFMVDSLYHGDTWMTVADFATYDNTQRSVGTLFADQRRWMKKAAINTASCGWFSSDRTIREYAEGVWGAMPPIKIAAE
jgi:starch phosphorylase